jgi:4-hydroxy-tetrahydrodipicolinate synthase
MKYSRREAKDYAREHLRGIWAAALTPFAADGAIDERGLRANIRHWVDDLGIAGLFIAGKQGEFFSMSVEERKRAFEIAVAETGPESGTIVSCSDQNMDTAIELARPPRRWGRILSWCTPRCCTS